MAAILKIAFENVSFSFKYQKWFLNIDVYLIKVSIIDDSKLRLHYIWLFFSLHGGHFENHPKWWVNPKISSVNILILNQEGPLNKMVPFVEVAEGGAWWPLLAHGLRRTDGLTHTPSRMRACKHTNTSMLTRTHDALRYIRTHGRIDIRTHFRTEANTQVQTWKVEVRNKKCKHTNACIDERTHIRSNIWTRTQEHARGQTGRRTDGLTHTPSRTRMHPHER